MIDKWVRTSLLIGLLATTLGMPVAMAQSGETNPVAIEIFRSQMIEIGEIYQELGVGLDDPVTKSRASDLVTYAISMSDEDIALLTSVGFDLGDYLRAARVLRDAAADAADRPAGGSPRVLAGIAKTAGFPDANYGLLCGSERPDPVAVIAATAALEAAKAIWSAADRGCNETIVILGEGGNTSLVCIVADAALFLAEKALETFKGCRESINAVEIDGSYDRLGHMHEDLELSVAADAQSSIEQNLMLAAPTQNIASFQLPMAFGGQLEAVAVVVQTAIDNMTAAGQRINFAQTFFDQAEALAAGNEYKRAYLMYKRAYQEVVRLP